MNKIVGLFDQQNAKRSIEVLEKYGVDSSDISLVVRDSGMVELRVAPYLDFTNYGFIGFLCGLGAFSFASPEVGPVIACGPLAVKVFTMLETKVYSSFSSALMHEGFSEEEAEIYIGGLKRGDILISADTCLPYPSQVQEGQRERAQM
ncbi:MAG: hypothetical protein H7Y59_12350 [Anaerolineales bacterium]|nr:hypothetical protein [Anaerolineales bacterium]